MKSLVKVSFDHRLNRRGRGCRTAVTIHVETGRFEGVNQTQTHSPRGAGNGPCQREGALTQEPL